MTAEGPLLSSTDGAVRLLTFNRPHKKNAFDGAMAAALEQALAAARDDEEVRVVVLTGTGDVFCAGADLSVFLEMGGGGQPDDAAALMNLHRTMRGFPKPLVAAVQGKAVGMGVTLLPHCDLVYASDRSTFLTPFVRLGLVLEYGSSFTLPRLLGRQRTNELILRAKPIDARLAYEWGLVTRVFPHPQLLDRVMEVAADLAAQPPGAVAEAKQLIQQGEESALEAAIERENEILAARYGSEENVQAVQSFLASRKPKK